MLPGRACGSIGQGDSRGRACIIALSSAKWVVIARVTNPGAAVTPLRSPSWFRNVEHPLDQVLEHDENALDTKASDKR